jgi:hypothetical protein
VLIFVTPRWVVGTLMKALEDLGVADDTPVVF